MSIAAVLITLIVGGPIAWWATSPRRRIRRYARLLTRAVAEVGVLLAVPLPTASTPTAALWVRDGRIYAVGSGVRDGVGTVSAPTASGQLVVSPDQLVVVGAGAMGSTSCRASASTTRSAAS